MIDLAILLAFVVWAISAGFMARRRASRGLDEYFLAGRTVKGWRAGASMAATQFAADTPLLVAGLIATGGIFLFWQLWVYGIAFLLLGFLFAPYWRRAGVLTDAELVEIRYSGKLLLTLRVLKAGYFGLLLNSILLGFVAVAALRISEIFALWHEWIPQAIYEPIASAVAATGLEFVGGATGLSPEVATTNNIISLFMLMGFTALYATTGGLRAVISTDVIQLAVGLGGSALYAWLLLDAAGGLGPLIDSVFELYGQETARRMLSFIPQAGENLLLPFLVIMSLQWLFQFNSDGTGYLAQRSMACETDRDARIAAVLFAWIQVVARSLIWLLIAVSLLVIYPFTAAEMSGDGFRAAREMTFALGIADQLPPGVKGIMITAMLAAFASTVDTHLNWGASYWSNDFYKRLICGHWLKRVPTGHELVLVARLSNLLTLALGLIVAFNLGSIQEGWKASLMFGAGIGSVMILRWLWERVNQYAEIAAMLVGLVLGIYLLQAYPGNDYEWIRLSVMAAVSTATVIIVSYLTPRTDDETLLAFYRRVRPGGLWKRVAVLAGEDPARPGRRLWRGLMLTALTSLSLFLTLVGAGKLMFLLPGEFWLPAAAALGAGLLLIPLWWRAAFPKGEDSVSAPGAPDTPGGS